MSTMTSTLNRAGGRSGMRRYPRTRSAYLMHRCRLALGLTMRHLARAMGASITSVVRWEGGSAAPSTLSQRHLALALNCPFLADWDLSLVEDAGTLNSPTPAKAEIDAWVRAFYADQQLAPQPSRR